MNRMQISRRLGVSREELNRRLRLLVEAERTFLRLERFSVVGVGLESTQRTAEVASRAYARWIRRLRAVTP